MTVTRCRIIATLVPTRGEGEVGGVIWGNRPRP
jgi:hypothetical protein